VATRACLGFNGLKELCEDPCGGKYTLPQFVHIRGKFGDPLQGFDTGRQAPPLPQKVLQIGNFFGQVRDLLPESSLFIVGCIEQDLAGPSGGVRMIGN
jgi:hypothetical protein